MKPKPMAQLLGLAFEREGFTAAVMRQDGKGLSVQRLARLGLALDPTSGDPELVGREIRHLLDDSGLRERRCLVCLPLDWALTARVDLPDLPEADQTGFLQIRAEREFPMAPEDIRVGISRFSTRSGSVGATLAAIPLARLTPLLHTLKAARLRLVGVTLGAAALATAQDRDTRGRAIVVGDGRGVDLAVAAGGGIVALRRVEESSQELGPGDRLDTRAVAKQIRITLGNLPKGLDEDPLAIQTFGDPRVIDGLAAEVEAALRRSELKAEIIPGNLGRELNLNGAREAGAAAPLLAAMAMRLRGRPLEFDFLLPPRRKTAEKGLRAFKRGTIWGVAAAVTVAVGLVGAVIAQRWYLSVLEGEWDVLKAPAAQVETLQSEIRGVRPWLDHGLPDLRVMRLVAEAFPERGTVWATLVQIKDGSEVSLSGRAESGEALLGVLDRLRKSGGVEDLRVLQVQEASGKGERSVFSLNFRWNPRNANGS